MGIRSEGASVFRDYEIDGSPSSGVHEPVKQEIRDLFGTVDDAFTLTLSWLASQGAVIYDTYAQLSLDTSAPGTVGIVTADADTSLIGIYTKSATTSPTVWTLVVAGQPWAAVDAATAAAIAEITAAADTAAGIGFTFSTTTTDSDPGTGVVRFNSATLSAVTYIYFDNANVGGSSVTPWLDSFDDSTSDVRGQIYIQQPSGTAFAIFNVTGSVVDGTGYRKVPVTYVTGSTLPTNAARISVLFSRTGNSVGGVGFTFSTTTTDSDPGSGVIRYNNATIASVTYIYADNNDVAGTAATGFLDSLDDPSATPKGQLTVSEASTGKSAVFNVTGAVVDGTGYRKIPVTWVSGVLPTNGNRVSLFFSAHGADTAASAIARSSDAYRFGRSFFDTETGNGSRDYPAQLALRMFMGTLAGGAVKNANGTYTLPAGATWTSPTLGFSPFNVPGNIYAYVPATTATSGAIQIKFYQGGTVVAAGSTTTEPSSGVYRQTWTNAGSLGSPQIEIKNASGSSITIYPAEFYSTDSAYLPQIIRFDEYYPVAEDREVIDFDLISPLARRAAAKQAYLRARSERDATNVFDSVSGNNASAGTFYAPMKDLTSGSALAVGKTIGLLNKSSWNQSVNTMLGSTTEGLEVRNISRGRVAGPLPVLDGMVSLAGAVWTSEGSGTFSTTIACDAAYTTDNYSYGTVLEITTSQVATMPRRAERMMFPVNVVIGDPTNATPITNVKAVAGRSLIVKLTSTSLKVYVHPTDGLEPGTGAYSYRASNLNSVMDWQQGNTRQSIVTGIEMRGGAKGLGTYCSSNQTRTEGVIVAHGYKHTLHIEAGHVLGAVIYNNGQGLSTANCYISPTANGYSWRWEDTLIYSVASGSAMYCHSAAGNFDRGDIDHVWALALNSAGDVGREPTNGSLCIGDPMNSDATLTLEEQYTLTYGYSKDGRAGSSGAQIPAHRHHWLTRACGSTNSRYLMEEGYAQLENISGVAIGDRNLYAVHLQYDHTVQNNCFLLTNVDTSATAGTSDYVPYVYDIYTPAINTPSARKNLIIVYCPLATSLTLISETTSDAYDIDENVYVFFGSVTINAHKNGGGTTTRLAQYLTNFAPTDANSIFFDYRDDPRGPDAIFRDWQNGDFRWADTPQAAAVKAACISLGAGPSWVLPHWPTVPTVEEACDQLTRIYA